MKSTILLRLAIAVAGIGLLASCAPIDDLSMMPPPPAPKPLDLDVVDSAVKEASGSTTGTTIYSNVLNLSGGSCVDAATKRGEAIADSLENLKAKGDIPADHKVKVYTYSGYRVPGIEYGSLHTYTVTQLYDGAGKPVATWTSDNYLGPNAVTRYPGDGGYGNWNDPLTNEVTRPKVRPPAERSGGGGC